MHYSDLEWPGDRDGLDGDLWGAHPAGGSVSERKHSFLKNGTASVLGNETFKRCLFQGKEMC